MQERGTSRDTHGCGGVAVLDRLEPWARAEKRARESAFRWGASCEEPCRCWRMWRLRYESSWAPPLSRPLARVYAALRPSRLRARAVPSLNGRQTHPTDIARPVRSSASEQLAASHQLAKHGKDDKPVPVCWIAPGCSCSHHLRGIVKQSAAYCRAISRPPPPPSRTSEPCRCRRPLPSFSSACSSAGLMILGDAVTSDTWNACSTLRWAFLSLPKGCNRMTCRICHVRECLRSVFLS